MRARSPAMEPREARAAGAGERSIAEAAKAEFPHGFMLYKPSLIIQVLMEFILMRKLIHLYLSFQLRGHFLLWQLC